MKAKTKKLTQKVWNSLDKHTKERILDIVFIKNPVATELLSIEKPNMKDPMWMTVFACVKMYFSKPQSPDSFRFLIHNRYVI